jgi:hypothetical protein
VSPITNTRTRACGVCRNAARARHGAWYIPRYGVAWYIARYGVAWYEARCGARCRVGAVPERSELELELIQSHMTQNLQKPMLRGEVGVRALRVRSVPREEVRARLRCAIQREEGSIGGWYIQASPAFLS